MLAPWGKEVLLAWLSLPPVPWPPVTLATKPPRDSLEEKAVRHRPVLYWPQPLPATLPSPPSSRHQPELSFPRGESNVTFPF